MGPRIWFQLVPERKAAKNRAHLDIDVTLRLSVPSRSGARDAITPADPEGNDVRVS